MNPSSQGVPTLSGGDVAALRPPGVYGEPQEQRYSPIALGRSGIVGFLGLTERGPSHVPVRITGIPQFYEVFGDFPPGGFLAAAVEAFFRNGGQECFVVRVVHRPGGRPGDFACSASLRILDLNGEPTLLVEAQNEGVWGNAVRVSARVQPPRAQTFLTLDAHEGDCEVTIRSTHGFRPGTLVRLFNETEEHFRFVVAVAEKTLHWSLDEPLPRALSASAPTYVEPVEFELRVQSPFANEVFRDLSMHPGSPMFVERVVADRSRLIRVKSLSSPSPPPRNLPAAIEAVPLEGGRDGVEEVSPDDFIGMTSGPGERTGLASLELIEEVDLLAAPDVMWLFQRNQKTPGMPFSTLKDVEVVHDAMIAQCERLNDRFAILDSPFPDLPGRTREYRLQFDTRFAALYFPWVVIERRGERLAIPPCGHVAGVFARCDAAMGVHRAPANEVLEGADDLAIILRDEDIGALNAEGINCIRAASVRGLRVWGARVVTSDPQFRYINVRRILNAINKAMSTHLQWVVFEPNVPSLWKTLTRSVTNFLTELWRKGYFTGRTPEEAFFVKCDDETNPPEERDAGRLTIEVGVAPVRPAEYLVLRVAQEMQGGTEGTP